MAHDKKRQNVGGIYVLPKKNRNEESRVREARRAGLLGTDRAGGW